MFFIVILNVVACFKFESKKTKGEKILVFFKIIRAYKTQYIVTK